MNQLDNAYSGIINIMREQGTKYNAPALMLGEVISSEPILIKAGDIQLDKDNLYIADYLMPDYSREASLTGSISFSSSNVGGSTDARTFEHSHTIASHSHTVEAHSHTVDSHSHTATVDDKTGSTNSVSGSTNSVGGSTNEVSLSTDTKTHTHVHDITSISVNADDLTAEGKFELTNSGLRPGDKVAIQQLQGTNKFVVFCRLI